MNETAKCHNMRLRDRHFDLYLKGSGIDIGCGPDVLRPPDGTVRPWDLHDGDAMLMSGVADNAYDFVYSSHCLEHLVDVKIALYNWVRILKPGGFLYFVVPDWYLYEKQQWPSRFNQDHKHTFSAEMSLDPQALHYVISRDRHWHAHHVTKYLQSLGTIMLDVQIQKDGFDDSRPYEDQTKDGALSQILFIAQRSQNFQAVKK